MMSSSPRPVLRRALPVLAGLLLSCLFLPARSQAQAQPRYFPLDLANQWTYVPEGLSGPKKVVLVTEEGPSGFLVLFEGKGYTISGPPDQLDIGLPAEGTVPFYRFTEPQWVHHDFDPCNDGVTIVASGKLETVQTPAGDFTDCLRLDYTGGQCGDAGKVSEWWKIETGLVRWTEQSFAGERAWVLDSFVRDALRPSFRRGDVLRDGGLDLSDAISIMIWLFLGEIRPLCEDVADVNDDGEVDLSDPIGLLGYLFLGGSTPPPPGPASPGFDPTTEDPYHCGDSPFDSCRTEGTSTLPGVGFDLSEVPCVLTLDEADAGVVFRIRTVIGEAHPGTTTLSLDAGGCDAPDPSGLAVLEEIQGDGQRYCLCDMGRCAGQTHIVDLSPGVYETGLEWDGRNWFGPSDTGFPKGEPFPPGLYRLQVRTAGTYRDEDGKERSFEVSAWAEFHLVP